MACYFVYSIVIFSYKRVCSCLQCKPLELQANSHITENNFSIELYRLFSSRMLKITMVSSICAELLQTWRFKLLKLCYSFFFIIAPRSHSTCRNANVFTYIVNVTTNFRIYFSNQISNSLFRYFWQFAIKFTGLSKDTRWKIIINFFSDYKNLD